MQPGSASARSEEIEACRSVLNVNGATREVAAEPETPLLYVLRNDLEAEGRALSAAASACAARAR